LVALSELSSPGYSPCARGGGDRPCMHQPSFPCRGRTWLPCHGPRSGIPSTPCDALRASFCLSGPFHPRTAQSVRRWKLLVHDGTLHLHFASSCAWAARRTPMVAFGTLASSRLLTCTIADACGTSALFGNASAGTCGTSEGAGDCPNLFSEFLIGNRSQPLQYFDQLCCCSEQLSVSRHLRCETQLVLQFLMELLLGNSP
jgi:hypothetical protein